MLQLDALTLPSPSVLVAELQSVGATAFAAYCWRRAADGSWLPIYVTPAHLTAMRQAGIRQVAIVVPGSSPTSADINASLDAAVACGYDPARDLIGLDLEQFSLPAGGWESQWVAAARARAWKAGRYGTSSTLAGYALADWSWISAWRSVAGGDLNPMPAYPAGGAWQYSHAIVLASGTDYDASVIDPSLFPGGGFLMGLTDQQQQDVYGWAHDTKAYIDNDLQPFLAGFVVQTLQDIQARVIAVQTPTVDVNALAAALATHPLTATLSDAERDAVAQHVLTTLRTQFDKP